MSRKNPEKVATGPAASAAHCEAAKRSARPTTGGRAAAFASDEAQPPPDAPASDTSKTLLTPQAILSRLSITSADPAKWMRRTFKKHGVPYVHACGQLRATEGQYQLLLEKITCSPSAPVKTAAFTLSEGQSRLATGASPSTRSVQARVTQMLRRT